MTSSINKDDADVKVGSKGNTRLDAALRYTGRAWPVFPVYGIEDGHCDCPHGTDCVRPGKHPHVKWRKGASTDADQIRAWWEKWPNANVGIATGDGLTVIDVDGDEGLDSLKALQDEHDWHPACPTVRTGSGGLHLYLETGSQPIGTSAGSLGVGLDVRGEGGYIIAPPSGHVSGGTYEWLEHEDGRLAQVPKWMAKALVHSRGVKTGGTVKTGTRHAVYTSLAGTMRRKGMAKEAILAALKADHEARGEGEFPEEELDRIAADIAAKDVMSFEVQGYARTDLGNTDFHAAMWEGLLKFVVPWNTWLMWSGTHWRRISESKAKQLAIAAVRLRTALSWEVDDEKERIDHGKWAAQSQAANKIAAIERLGRSHEELMDEAGDRWDQKPYLLACKNGTVDLRTGELREANPADYLTLNTHVEYDPAVRSPLWDNGVAAWLSNDHDLIPFIRTAIGYGATGETREELGFILTGSGGNGKGCFIDGISYALGDYAFEAGSKTLKKNAKSLQEGRYLMKGRRFVTVDETVDGFELDAEFLKAWLGQSIVIGEMKYGHEDRRETTAKPFIVTNYLPRVDDITDGFWRKLMVVHFLHRFVTGVDRDLYYRDKLRDQRTGILTWIVEGAKEWYASAGGLGRPKRLMEWTERYREEADPFLGFIRQRCEEGAGLTARSGKLLEAYQSWCRWSGVPESQQLSSKTFPQRLAKTYSKGSDKRGAYYEGVALHEMENDEPTEEVAY